MNNKIINKLPGAVLAVLMLLSLVFAGLVWFGPLDGVGFQTPTGTPLPVPLYTDALIVWMYIMLGFTALVTIALAILKFAKNLMTSPKQAMKPLIVIVALLAVFGVSWTLGSQERIEILGYTGSENYGPVAQMIDMVLFTMYALLTLIVFTIACCRVYVAIKLKK